MSIAGQESRPSLAASGAECDRFPASLRSLHWLTAGLVVVQVALAAANALLYESRPVLAETLVSTHLSFGLLILLLTVIRLAVRLGPGAPRPPTSPIAFCRWAARIAHTALYGLLIRLPLSGYVKLAALGFEIGFFGLFTLPALAFDPALTSDARQVHSAAALLLGLLLALHVTAALLHRRLDGCAVLQRML